MSSSCPVLCTCTCTSTCTCTCTRCMHVLICCTADSTPCILPSLCSQQAELARRCLLRCTCKQYPLFQAISSLQHCGSICLAASPWSDPAHVCRPPASSRAPEPGPEEPPAQDMDSRVVEVFPVDDEPEGGGAKSPKSHPLQQNGLANGVHPGELHQPEGREGSESPCAPAHGCWHSGLRLGDFQVPSPCTQCRQGKLHALEI